MNRGLAADGLGELQLGDSADKQELQVRSCLGLMLETETGDICEECLPGTTPLL